MKIIENNYKEINEDDIEEIMNIFEKRKEIEIECDVCNSILKITEDDTYIGAYGLRYIVCPCCNKEIQVEEIKGIELNENNIEFPLHFSRTFKENAVDKDNKFITQKIKNMIKEMKEKKLKNLMYQGGDLLITITKINQDYNIIVTKDYYEVDIYK